MGVYAPAPIATPAVLEFVRTRVLQAAVDGMRAEGRPFVGLLYAGIMVCPNTDGGSSASGTGADANGLEGIHIQTLEFNCRFGDPETQVVLPLLASDLYQVCLACATGRLDRVMPLAFHEGAAAVTVVAASGGYPGVYAVGKRITGVAAAEEVDAARGRVTVFHAGTALKAKADDSGGGASEENDELVTAGGRVLAVTAVGASFVEARALAYAGVAQIAFEGMHYRTDIGYRALRRLEEAEAATGTAATAAAAEEDGVSGGKRAPLRVAVLGSTRGTALQPLIDLLQRQNQRLGSESHSAAVSASPADEPLLDAAICLVVSNKADAPILERARRHALPTALIEAKGRAREAVDEELSAVLLEHRIDLVLLVGYMRILSVPFARAWAGRVLNVHPSLLPAFAGGMDLQVCVCLHEFIFYETLWLLKIVLALQNHVNSLCYILVLVYVLVFIFRVCAHESPIARSTRPCSRPASPRADAPFTS
jgi:folate-dependent phosphoribosylglycinamide formyltransferase PurN